MVELIGWPIGRIVEPSVGMMERVDCKFRAQAKLAASAFQERFGR